MIDVDDDEGFEQHRARFYSLIGHCVTGYQSIEDYLPELFGAALADDPSKATAIFAVARGLEAKLDIISAALIGADERHFSRWTELRPHILLAAKARNQIAHASPTHHGGTIAIALNSNPEIAPKMTRTESSRMELRKRTRAGETVWTTDLMRAEYERSHKLFGHLIALAMELRGEKPPSHLLEP